MKNLFKKFFLRIFILAIFIIGSFSVAEGQYGLLAQDAASQVNQTNIDFFVDWSADTFIPPDYQGRALPTFQSIVTLNATLITPIKSRSSEDSYSFNWLLDNSTVLPSNGPTASFEVKKAAGDNHKIYLRIFDKNRNIIKDKFLTIPITSPQMALFREGSDGLLLNNTGQELSTTKKSELNLVVKPIFFNKISSENSLIYSWRLNNQPVNTNFNKISLFFPDNIQSGTQHILGLSAQNPLDIFQVYQKNYTIKVK